MILQGVIGAESVLQQEREEGVGLLLKTSPPFAGAHARACLSEPEQTEKSFFMSAH